jgi:hypothetical protein
MPAKTRSVTKFLNMDLDIHAQTGLEQLLRSISSSVMVLHQAEQKASVELNESFASLEETAVGLVKLINSMGRQARDIWDQCEWQRLNIGIQAGNEPYASTFAISSKTVSMLADAKFEVSFTVYAPRS